MNHLIHPAVLADSTTQNRMHSYLMGEASRLIKTWLALTVSEDYRQTYKAVQREFVTLCALESYLHTLLQTTGLPADIQTLAQEYLERTEGLSDDVWDYARERWPNPEEALKDALYEH